jgi:hypothetical protein
MQVVVTTVADLTDEHRGWLVKVDELPSDSLFPLRHRSFVLGKGFGSGVRRWEHEGVQMVGLTDDVRSPGIVGTERAYPADTPCELVRQVKKPRRRATLNAKERA